MNIERGEILNLYHSLNMCIRVRPIEKMKEISQ